MKDKNGNWLEPEIGTDMSNLEGRLFKKEPAINVISKEEFEKRIEKVFRLLWKTLSKSFGPYGAPTLIYKYPYRHITKDGYTIMKSLSMDASETLVDQAIADMASDICGRLNYSVGDGTTTAVIATNSIYQRYRAISNDLTNKFILPRDVMSKFNGIKTEVISRMESSIKEIRTEDREKLRENIHDVVYISSNGDDEITDYISDLYAELGTPAITCVLASDGITKKKLISGYRYNLMLNDRLYINNDNQTMDLEEADIVIFSTKITANTYKYILKPLNSECKMRGRHLIVAAPTYDDVALRQTIAVDLNNEYSKSHDVNMVLTTYRAINGHTRKLINDFSVLMNTTIIDSALERIIMDQVTSGTPISSIISIDNREIKGTKCIAYPGDPDKRPILYNCDEDVLPSGYSTLESLYDSDVIANQIRLGYTKNCSLGLKTSLFKELLYDEDRYQAILDEARTDLDEAEKKYQKLGTFNLEVSHAQERLYALYLKMGIIEVGGDSELSSKLRKDAVDDAIKAASSAFNHGVVLGCNTSLLKILHDMDNEKTDIVNKILIDVVYEGFLDVYRTVLSNAFADEQYQYETSTGGESRDEIIGTMVNQIKMRLDESFNKSSDDIFNDEPNILYEVAGEIYDRYNGTISIHNILIFYSIATNQVFDVTSFSYSDRIINSFQTDEEVLIATIDLISMLITGNQMVITQKQNFDIE